MNRASHNRQFPPANQFPRARLRAVSWNWAALDPDTPDNVLVGRPAPPDSPSPIRAFVPVGGSRGLENHAQVCRATEDGSLRTLEAA